MSFLSSLLHPEKGYQDAQNQLGQYFNLAQSYQAPFQQQALAVSPYLVNVMQALLNPKALSDTFARSYKLSDLAKSTQGLAKEAGLDSASSMGLLGSNTALNALQEGETEIGLQDRQNYLADLMDKYMKGAAIAGNFYNTGASAANQLGQNALNTGNQMAEFKFGEDAAPGDLLSKLLGTGASLVGGYLNGPSGGWNLSGGR